MRKRRLQEPWMADLRIGDVLEDCNGTQRVVRELTRYADGDLRCVTFVIRSCSWTGRPYTLLNYHDLKYRGFKPSGYRKRLGSSFDWKLHREFKSITRPSITCCDVKGIA